MNTIRRLPKGVVLAVVALAATAALIASTSAFAGGGCSGPLVRYVELFYHSKPVYEVSRFCDGGGREVLRDEDYAPKEDSRTSPNGNVTFGSDDALLIWGGSQNRVSYNDGRFVGPGLSQTCRIWRTGSAGNGRGIIRNPSYGDIAQAPDCPAPADATPTGYPQFQAPPTGCLQNNSGAWECTPVQPPANNGCYWDANGTYVCPSNPVQPVQPVSGRFPISQLQQYWNGCTWDASPSCLIRALDAAFDSSGWGNTAGRQSPNGGWYVPGWSIVWTNTFGAAVNATWIPVRTQGSWGVFYAPNGAVVPTPGRSFQLERALTCNDLPIAVPCY